MHQMLTHNFVNDHEILTTTFIDVSWDEIRIVVIIQRPQDLDIAGFLTIIQEVLEILKHRANRHRIPQIEPSLLLNLC